GYLAPRRTLVDRARTWCLFLQSHCGVPPLSHRPVHPAREKTTSRHGLQAIGGGLNHCAVQHTVSEVSYDDRRGLAEKNLLAPLLKARKEEASSGGDCAYASSRCQQFDGTLDERRIHVVLGARVRPHEILLGARAAGTEGRIHQHRVEVLFGHGQQPYAVRYVLSEEPLPRT